MAQKYGFFNSVNNDRVYDASDVARFLSKFFTNGVFNNSLAVSSNDNMTISVATGNANINGYGYENTETLVLDIDEADSELGRIDSVIVRLDLTNRQITTQILEGQYATTPSQPSITRTGTIYDLRLANVSIPAGATRITADMITDTRFGSDCGNVTQAVLELDTSEIFKQYETWFTEWFSNLEDQLDDNQAGHLQNEIGTLSNLETENKTNLVNAVNEVYEYAQDLLVNEYNESTTLGYSANYVNNLVKDIYSTDEIKTNKVYVDENNKKHDVYRKVIRGTKGNDDLDLGIVSSDLTRVTETKGILVDTSNNKKPLPYFYSTNIWLSYEVNTSKKLMLYGAASQYSRGTVEVTVEYTKD